MQMHRREYKKKAADSALEEAAEVVSDLDNWESNWPTLIEKINSTRIELRVSALQSMNKILTARFIGYENLDPYLDDTMNSLHGPIFDRASRAEHDEALGVACNLALNTFSEFEPYVHVFLNDLMPTLSDTTEEESFRFFTIAFVVSLAVSHQDLCMTTVKALFNLMMNKKSRTTDFTQEMTAECIRSVCLLLSSFPDHIIAGLLYADIQALLDLATSNLKAPVILAAIELVPIVYEAVIANEAEAASEEAISAVQSKQFVAKYRSKLADLGSDLAKKSDQRAVKQRVKEILEILDGETVQEDIVLNNQNIMIEGVRKNVILQAIRRVTKVHFQQQMAENDNIHELFGFTLLSQSHALRLKKKFKSDIQKERETNKKDREMEIAKKRKQKAGL